jgi:hypothetical protein
VVYGRVGAILVIAVGDGDRRRGRRPQAQLVIMNEEAVAFGQNVQVVDPDVRAHVYSLVTAVRIGFCIDVLRADLGSDKITARWLQWRRCGPIRTGR